MNTIFITGTDTGVGKTMASVLWLKKLNQQGLKTFAMKPIASGCTLNQNGILENDDALILQKTATIYRPYSVVNPIALQEPIAPHLAAKKMHRILSVDNVLQAIQGSLQTEADVNLIEGVGGWNVPLNDTELFSDVIACLKIPVILVVAIKLGCLNHAILTYQAILQKKVPLLGWIANCIETDTLALNDNIATLAKWIPAPCLGVVSYGGLILEQLSP